MVQKLQEHAEGTRTREHKNPCELMKRAQGHENPGDGIEGMKVPKDLTGAKRSPWTKPKREGA